MGDMRKVLTKKFFERNALKVAENLLGKFLCRSALGGATAKSLRRPTSTCYMITEVEAYDGFRDKASHAHRGRTLRNAPMFGEAGRWYVYFTYGMHWMLNIVIGPKDYPAAVLIRGLIGQSEQLLASFSPSQRWAPKLQPFRSDLRSDTMPKRLQKSARSSRLALADSQANILPDRARLNEEAENFFAGLASSRRNGDPQGLRSSREESKKVARLPLNGPAKLTKFLKIDKRFNNLPANRKTGLWIEDRGVKFSKSRIKKTPRIGVSYAQAWAKKKMRFIIKE